MANSKTANQQAVARRKAVIDLIRSRPHMAHISLSEVTKVCAYSGTGSASEMLSRMQAEGLITQHKVARQKSAYTINEDAVARLPYVQRVNRAEYPARQALGVPRPTEITLPQMSSEAKAVRALVLEYYWQSHNDSLRQFVTWLEEGHLHE